MLLYTVRRTRIRLMFGYVYINYTCLHLIPRPGNHQFWSDIIQKNAAYNSSTSHRSKENTKKEETSESTVNKSKSEDSKVTLRDGAIARDVAMTSSRDKCLSRDTSCLSKSSSKLSMGTVSSSGYGSFVSSGSGKNCVRPSTATGNYFDLRIMMVSLGISGPFSLINLKWGSLGYGVPWETGFREQT